MEYYNPTPEEIRATCLLIQATWTPEIEIDRRVTKPQSPTFKEYNENQIRTNCRSH